MRGLSFSILVLVSSALLTSACTENVTPLTAEEKAAYVLETLKHKIPACEALKEKVAANSHNKPVIDGIYEEAKKTHCLKDDI